MEQQKIDLFWIPISIILFLVVIIILIYIIYKIIANYIKKYISSYIKKIEDELETAMHSICEETYTPIDITSSKSYDRKNAYSLNQVCNTTSSWAKCKTDIALIPSFSVIKTFQLTDPVDGSKLDNAILMYSKSQNIAVISFSGTVFLNEWIDDFDFEHQKIPSFLQNDDKNILAEKDQCMMYESMRDEILSTLTSISDDKTFVYCTGHSLGGVLASLCFLDLIINKPGVQCVLYSFGSPRVGNIPFADKITKTNNAYRIVNTEDIIPTLPLPVMKNNTIFYEHYGEPITFTLNLKNLGSNHTTSYEKYLK
jgi:triacylglycerol lipase